jgi:hypothetical protein
MFSSKRERKEKRREKKEEREEKKRKEEIGKEKIYLSGILKKWASSLPITITYLPTYQSWFPPEG